MEIQPLDANPSRGIIILLIRDGKSPGPSPTPLTLQSWIYPGTALYPREAAQRSRAKCSSADRRERCAAPERSGARRSKAERWERCAAPRSGRAERSEAQHRGAARSGEERGAAAWIGAEHRGAARREAAYMMQENVNFLFSSTDQLTSPGK